MINTPDDGIVVAVAEIMSGGGKIIDGIFPCQAEMLNSISNAKRFAERAATYRLLNSMLGVPYVICHRVNGQPYLVDIEGNKVNAHISVSHSSTVVGIVMSGKWAVGIDIQDPSEKISRVRDRFLSGRELALLPDTRYLLMAWTVKEAVYKAVAIGGLPLKNIVIGKITEMPALNGCPSFNTQVYIDAHGYGTLDVMSWFDSAGRAFSLVAPGCTSLFDAVREVAGIAKSGNNV